MPIITGQTAQAADFVSTSGGAGDAGKVSKLNSSGKIDNSFLTVKFGGNGSDGSLSISSGTTSVNLGGASVVVKNYTSISITGTGKLAFTNPNANGTFVVLKSQGDVTLTSSTAPMIDCRNTGGAGSASVSGSIGTLATITGNSGHSAQISSLQTNGGEGGWVHNPAVGGVIPTIFGISSNIFTYILSKFNFLAFAGAGGGAGGVSTGNAGSFNGNTAAGGSGGGALLIECGGAWNFTTAGGISVAGTAGSNGNSGGGGNTTVAGGGGGGGGFGLALYNTLIANSGTFLCAGGSGGTASMSSGGAAFGGAGGGSVFNAGANGGNYNGGAGGNGFSLVASNTEFI